jgi:hydrogenase maturation protease
MTNPHPQALVVGYGSTLRGDDAFGPYVAQRLQQQIDEARVRVIQKYCLTPEIAGELAEVDLAIFIDVALDGAVGRLNCRRLESVPDRRSTLAHCSEPAELLALAQELYRTEPRCYLVSVVGQLFDLDPDRLSAPVQSAVEPATRMILSILDHELSDQPRRADPVHVRT